MPPSSPPTAAPVVAPIVPTPTQTEDARRQQVRLGIVVMCGVSLVFSIQDVVAKQLGGSYSALLIVMLRYWFFTVFSVLVVSRGPGGLRGALRTRRPLIQLLRGLLLIADVVLTLLSFVRLGVVNSHAVFAIYPLMIVALSGPFLGERIGWRRWTAVGAGFVGMLVILQPGAGTMSAQMLLPLGAALCFAVYGVLTRLVSQDDSANTSFLWTSLVGVVAITPLGLANWQWLAADDWAWLGLLCVCAGVSHWSLIRAYALAEASVLQPFAYTQLLWISIFGVLLLHEPLAPNVVVGIVIIVGAGLFSLWRSRVRSR